MEYNTSSEPVPLTDATHGLLECPKEHGLSPAVGNGTARDIDINVATPIVHIHDGASARQSTFTLQTWLCDTTLTTCCS